MAKFKITKEITLLKVMIMKTTLLILKFYRQKISRAQKLNPGMRSSKKFMTTFDRNLRIERENKSKVLSFQIVSLFLPILIFLRRALSTNAIWLTVI